jgi:hypothetical protein
MAKQDKKPVFVQTWEAFNEESLKVFGDIDIK